MNLSVRLLNAKHTKHVIARAIVCIMLLVLPSCQIPCLRQAEPGPLLPAGFNGATSPDNSAQFRIEEFYHDRLLTCLIQQALVNNRELKILDQEVQIAKNEVLARKGAYLPFVTVGAGGGLDQYSRYTLEGASLRDDPYIDDRHFHNPLPNAGAGFNLFWQLDPWRQLRNARDAAKRRYLAACERRNYFVTRLVAEIAEHYYDLMALDKRLETLDITIGLFETNLKFAKARKEQGRITDLPVQRFQAELNKYQSEKLIVNQEIVQVENRINFLVNRYPEHVARMSPGFEDFFNLNIHPLSVGVPSQLLHNRPDIRQAERELEAAGLDVKVARARFFPTLTITGGVGFESFNPAYIFTNPPEALAASVAGGLVAPLINTLAIQADYCSANARQLETVYNYQRVILNAFTEVINRVSKVENYRRSIEIKRQQLEALDKAVEVANKLFIAARVEYVEVLLAQRDLQEVRMVLIGTKQEQLSAIVNTYQALGGGDLKLLDVDSTLACGPRMPQPGPSLDKLEQGGSDRGPSEQLPAPSTLPGPGLPEQLPAPRDLSPLPDGGGSPDQLPKPSKLPERPPDPNKLPPSAFAPG